MRCVDKIPARPVWDQIARAHHDASNISDGGSVARLKDRSLPYSCEGSYQLVPWIDLFNWMFCFQIRQSRNLPFVSHKSCTHIHVDARERAREQSKERSGVRVQTESETGERHTPHGRVKQIHLGSGDRLNLTSTPSVHFKTKMAAHNGRCSVSTILRENRVLWTVWQVYW